MLNVTVNDQDAFEVKKEGDQWLLNNTPFNMDLADFGNNRFHIIHEGRSMEVEVLEKNYKEKYFRFRIDGREYTTQAENKLDRLLATMGIANGNQSKVNQVKAPMPGLIQSIAVKSGDLVKKGDLLLVLVAMKMENSIKAPGDGKVQSISVSTGQSVEKNHILIDFE
jgi:biotin carboxyl carrier protein